MGPADDWSLAPFSVKSGAMSTLNVVELDMMTKPAPTLPLPVHMGSMFTWFGTLGTAEASTLGEGFSDRVWSDALDTGFIVRGRTGTRLFVLEYCCHTEDGIAHWDFVCPDDRDLKVRVFND